MLCDMNRIPRTGTGELDASLATLAEVANHIARTVTDHEAEGAVRPNIRYFLDLARRHLERERKAKGNVNETANWRYIYLEGLLGGLESLMTSNPLDYEHLQDLLELWAFEQISNAPRNLDGSA